MSKTAIISIIDDDECFRLALEGLLRSIGYQVRTYSSAGEFLSSSGPHETVCLIADIKMPGMNGVQLYNELFTQGIHIPTIFISGHPGIPPRVKSGAARPEAFFPKPFHCTELIVCIEAVFSRSA